VGGAAAADSWATDLHKMLNVPYESALVAMRDGRYLHSSMSCAAPYSAPPSETTSASNRRRLMPEAQNSRRARGVAAWAAIQQLGTQGVADLVDRCCSHTVRLVELLQAGGAELQHPVQFNQALVRFGSDQQTAAVAAAVQLDGRCWVGATTYNGKTVMRLSVQCWRTTEADIAIAAKAILGSVESSHEGSLKALL
jgi:glutamate/tyrosine decarboxylase-like PLP-dependent enzyme